MGYVGGKIPGHSGTAQKHKKAFARQKQWAKGRLQREQTETQTRKVVGRYELQADDGRFTNWLMLFLVVMLLGAGYWWADGVIANDSSLQHGIELPSVGFTRAQETAGTKREGFTKEQTHAYNFLLRSGRKSFIRADYHVAVYEFDQALKIAPYAKQARLELLDAITKLCAEERYYCDRVEPQRTFLKEMGWLE